MSILHLFRVAVRSQALSKRIAFLFYFVVTLITVSCGSNSQGNVNPNASLTTMQNDSNARHANTTAGAQPSCPCNTLAAFYLENNEIQNKLLNGSHIGKKAKIIFQFTHEKQGAFGLIAWPGKRKHESFDLGSEKRLHQSKALSGLDIDGEDFILGDLQLGKSEADVLWAAVKANRYKYIVFTPDTVSDAIKHYKHIYYKIGGTNEDPNAFGALPPNITDITETNPSPPRGADEDF